MFKLSFGRPAAVAVDYMVATSQPLAVLAGLRSFERGGNAIDAALAAAAMLAVAEPFNCGPGGDLVALVWHDGDVSVLDAMGPAPAQAPPDAEITRRGATSVTVPGAPAGWAALASRYSQLGLVECFRDAVTAAEDGVALTPRVAYHWSAEDACPAEFGPASPRPGQRLRFPPLAATLQRIAETEAAAFYGGELAGAIAASSWLDLDDLHQFKPRWTTPVTTRYRHWQIHEAPPPTQGVAVLEALALVDGREPSLQELVKAVALALNDAYEHVRDGADISFLLEPEYLRKRRLQGPRRVRAVSAGTSFVCAARDGYGIALIQSLFGTFGSGIVVPETGIILQNRGACFAVGSRIEAGRRPFHTIIPAIASSNGELAAVFGLVGGPMQPQGQVQLISSIVDYGLDPQAALDRGRFCIQGESIFLEQDLWSRAGELKGIGFRVVKDNDWAKFGAGQAILLEEGGAFVGGSDPRMDGLAFGH